MRQVNTRFFFLLVGAVAALSAGLFGVHRLQAGNITAALLWQTAQAEKNGKPDLAARYIGRYLEFVPDDIDQRAHLGEILSDPKVIVTPAARRRAKFVLNQVLTWDPQRHDARRSLCRVALAGRELELAEEQLKILQQKLPGSADVALLAGQVKELQLQNRVAVTDKDRQRELLDAAKAYESAIKADPRLADAYVRLVGVLRQLDFGQDKPAHGPRIDELVAAALKNLPEDAAVRCLAAQRAQENGDFDTAKAHLEAGLQKCPTEPRIYQALARLYGQQGNRAEAIAQLKKGLQTVGKEHQFELTWTLANLLLDDEQMDAARKLIVQIRDINHLSADYLEARCMMLQGRWYDASRVLERVRPAFKTVPELALQVDLYLGTCYRKADEPLLQLAAFERVTKADPTSLMARHGVATALWALGQHERALGAFQALIDGNTDRAEAARWRLDYVRMLLEARNIRDVQRGAEVRRQLEAAGKEPGQAVECALLRSRLLLLENEVGQAEAELRRVIQENPKRFEPWLELAALAMPKAPKQAEQILEQAATSVEDTAEFRIARIAFWAQHGPERADVLEALGKDLGRFPAGDQARLLEALADAHSRAGRPADASRLLKQLATMPPHAEDVRVRMRLLGLAMAQDDETEMRRLLGEVKKIEGEPATEWSYGEALRLIWTYRKKGGAAEVLEQARSLLTAAGARRGDWPALFVARAELDELQKRPEQAIAGYRKAVELGSRDPLVLFQLVRLLREANRFDEVDVELRKVSQFGTDRTVGAMVVADSAQRQDYKAAVEMVRKIVRPDSKDFREWLLLGQMLAGEGKAAEAEAALRKAVAVEARQPEVWVALVRHLGASGQYDKALEEIAVAAKKLDAGVRTVALASCYEVLGAFDEAEKMYKQALADGPQVRHVRAAADFLLRAGKGRDAVPLYRAVLDGKNGATEDEMIGARRGLALALARGGDPRNTAEALELVGLKLDEAGKLDESGIAAATDARLMQARVLAALGSHALRRHAIRLLEALHQKQALEVEDQYQLAFLLHRSGPDTAAWQKAREVLEGITKAQPNNPRYLGLRANLLLLHKELPEAETLIGRLEQMEQERKLAAGLLGSVELKARALELRGKEQQAIALLQDFARQTDAPRGRLLLLAGLHGRFGNYAEAVDLCFELKQAKNPEEAHGAAIGVLRAGKPAAGPAEKQERWRQQAARVEASLRAAIRADERRVLLHLQLADLLELEGRYDDVEAVCRGIIEMDADNLVALNNLAWLLAAKEGRGQEAQGLIQRAIRRHGVRPELLDTRAVVYLSLGMAKEAVHDLEIVVREAPSPARYFHLMRAHHLAQNAPQALAALQRANELGLDVQRLHPNDQRAFQAIVPGLQQP
jgi:tetratricopeptide (TPR) repeat protein